MSETRESDDGRVSFTDQRRPTDPTTTDEAFELLGDYRRRQVVTWLQEAERPVAVAELARGVTQHGGDTTRVRLELDQHHLPKLDEALVVEYDREAGTVHAGERLGDLSELVEAALGALE
ncbi:DUF7344 domain-containing protein [Halomarina litorea]|uniref:DUF7344 domain-containing protein n=1 Tax=Halomarina litorea TaxID=2961595 RepID=UPI0020C44A3E|nr:hypothetical protein [Halomarina sp. BCD28]